MIPKPGDGWVIGRQIGDNERAVDDSCRVGRLLFCVWKKHRPAAGGTLRGDTHSRGLKCAVCVTTPGAVWGGCRSSAQKDRLCHNCFAVVEKMTLWYNRHRAQKRRNLAQIRGSSFRKRLPENGEHYADTVSFTREICISRDCDMRT